ncbi:hypothetical protein MJO29_002268 [Puccinia striiformis f. sp. tritici]|nr:hypothetical protein MJO29_002268 [Puccinia striiformis f. sp. tritici]
MATLKICDPDHPDHEAARASLIRKVDWHVLPGLSLLWLACFIDRTNIGNAKVGGMDHSLGLHGMQYNIGLAVFYVTYIASELPSNYMLRVLGGKIWLPFLVASWGIITIFSGFMKNYASLIVVRLLLGLFEGGLLPGMVVYLSTMYRRNELQLRVGIFFASASLSGAFGGLLAYGIEMMEGLSGQKGWQWVFFIEGIGTVAIALFALYYLPASLETASFLTPEEREFAVARLKFVPKLNQKTLPLEVEEAQADSLTSTQGADVDADAGATAEDKTAHTPRDLTRFETEKPLPLLNPDVKVGHETDGSSPVEKFEKYEIIRAFKEPQVWFTGIGYMSLCVGMYSYSLFLPSIVAGMGFHGTDAQLYSSFPYLPASVLVVIVAFVADKLQLRAPMVIMLLPLTIVGYILGLVATSNSMRYAGVFFMAAGIYPSVPSILCILPNNTAGLTKQSVATALQLMIANCAGFIATFIYTADQAPHYRKGHSIALAFTCLAWVMLGTNALYCAWENKARAAGRRDSNITKYVTLVQNGKTSAPIGDRAPDFKLTL